MKKRFWCFFLILLLLCNGVYAFASEGFSVQSYSDDSVIGFYVECTTDEGSLPSGTVMRVSSVYSDVTEQIKNSANEYFKGERNIVEVNAIKIEFDNNGEIINPEKPVHIKMVSDFAVENKTHIIFKVRDDKNVEIVTSKEKISTDLSMYSRYFMEKYKKEFYFDLCESAIYAIVETDDSTSSDNIENTSNQYEETETCEEQSESYETETSDNQYEETETYEEQSESYETETSDNQYEETETYEEQNESYETETSNNSVNTYEEEETSSTKYVETEVTGKLVWNDSEDQDGLRPENATIYLMANGDTIDYAEVDDGNFYFNNLRMYDEYGNIISYYIEVDSIEGYTKSIDDFVVKFTHEPETTEIKGEVKWSDSEDQDGLRPENATIYLLADGQRIDEITIKKGNKEIDFGKRPKYKYGQVINYSLDAKSVENYESPTIDNFNVIFTHKTEMTKVQGTISWSDNDNQDGVRKPFTIILNEDDTEIAELNVSEIEKKYCFDNLRKYEKGKKKKYSIKVKEIEGYKSHINGFNINNVHIPETINIVVNIIWKDNNNEEARPDKITILLKKNGEKIDEGIVTEYKKWMLSFDYLPKNENGKKINYEIDVKEDFEGYEAEVDDFNVILKPKSEESKSTETKKNSDHNNKSAPTGDNKHILPLIVIMVVCMASIIGLIYYNKKKNK